MTVILFMKLVGVLAFLAGHSFARLPVTTPGPQYYQTFQTVPAPAETATKLMTNFLRIPLGKFTLGGRGKRQTMPKEDIVIVMDGSGSIGSCEFDKGKKALKNMMDAATEAAMADIKYAAVTFGSSASVNFNFWTNPTAASRILQIPYPSGSTNTQAGLAEAKKIFENPSSGGRRRCRSEEIVLLVTDGQSGNSQLTISNAAVLKSLRVKIFVVVVGSYINGIDEMVKVASSPPEDHLFRVTSLSSFYDVIKLILQQVAPDKYNIVAGQYETPC